MLYKAHKQLQGQTAVLCGDTGLQQDVSAYTRAVHVHTLKHACSRAGRPTGS